MLDGCLDALEEILRASESLFPVLIVGCPLRVDMRLYNVAITVHRGRILGVQPKSYLPSYREFYEKRYFAPGTEIISPVIELGSHKNVPFGCDLLYCCEDFPDLVLFTEICEDLWAPLSPSTLGCLAGASVIVNLSASNITVGKGSIRRNLCAAQSEKCMCAYIYTAAGDGESTSDLAWDGYALVYDRGQLVASTESFAPTPSLLEADIDVGRISHERMQIGTFGDARRSYHPAFKSFRRIQWSLAPELNRALPPTHPVPMHPFVPSSLHDRHERCEEVYNIQVSALVQRLRAIGTPKLVIGVSGGLDSTQALLVAVRAFDHLGIDRHNILAYFMPGFASGDFTSASATLLMTSLGVTWSVLDIRPSCKQMLEDLNHPFAKGEPVYDVTFENVQAGERTSHLFRLANHHGGIVLGTGDLSEIALGWCTYGVGDHMSHYNVNASVPKTLISHLIAWNVECDTFGKETSAALQRVLDTEISPELVPGEQLQSTESVIGPYELQDFFLYYTTRYGCSPGKTLFLAYSAWRHKYDLRTCKKWLRYFLQRFFGFAQFKRTCQPNGPKVGSGGSLSCRGDWRAPSDGTPAAWLKSLDQALPDSAIELYE